MKYGSRDFELTHSVKDYAGEWADGKRHGEGQERFAEPPMVPFDRENNIYMRVDTPPPREGVFREGRFVRRSD